MSSMTTDTKYNGWHNYETWCINLWLSNDEGIYNMVNEIVSGAVDGDAEPDWQKVSVANAIEEFVKDLPEVTVVTEQASFVSDLLGAALSEVDWYEIAEAWMEDASTA